MFTIGGGTVEILRNQLARQLVQANPTTESADVLQLPSPNQPPEQPAQKSQLGARL
jgi:hypothetical protein